MIRNGLTGLREAGRAEDRAVSFTLGYVLTVGIAVILVSGMLVAVGGVVADERSRTIQDEADVVGDQTAAAFMAADRLVQGGNQSNVTIALRLPDRLAGQPYTLTVAANQSAATVIVRTHSPDVTVRTPLTNRTQIEAATVAGRNVRVVYRTGGRLTLEGGGG